MNIKQKEDIKYIIHIQAEYNYIRMYTWAKNLRRKIFSSRFMGIESWPAACHYK